MRLLIFVLALRAFDLYKLSHNITGTMDASLGIIMAIVFGVCVVFNFVEFVKKIRDKNV